MAPSRVDSTPVRTAMGLALTALVVGLAVADWWVGRRVILSVMLSAVVALGLLEFYRLAERAGGRPAVGFGVASGVILVWAQWARMQVPAAGGAFPVDPLLILGAAVVFGALAAQVIRHGVTGAWSNVGATVLGLAYVWLPLSFIGWLWGCGPEREPPPVGEASAGGSLGPLALFVVTVKLSDAGAYFVGRSVKGPRLAPVVSPKKTVSGAVGGCLVGMLVAVAFHEVWPESAARFSRAGVALFGLAVSVAGILGDLGESVLKRAAGAKDSGGLVPGFGGVLDMLDSVLGAAPVAYALMAAARGPAA